MLTNTAILKAKPGEKPRKLFDEKGLFLHVQPSGGKWWRFKYRFQGKEGLLSLGTFPEVSLAQARKRRDEARALIADGVNPSEVRRANRVAAGQTFETVAREWMDKFAPERTEHYMRTIRGRFEQHLFPDLGSRPIRDISAPDLLSVLLKIEARGTKVTAHRVRGLFSQVARYAIATGRAHRDPSPDLRGALAPVRAEHHPAITDPKKVGPFLRVLEGYDGSIVVRCALRLAPLVFVRPGELRKAEWTEIDLDKAQWTIPAFRMKMRQSLTVPLSRQAVAILRELHPVTGHGRYVFPSGRFASQRPMSDNAILAALRRCGIPKEEMTGHGFRALARTILDEVLGVRVDLIEHQLGHAVKDPNGRAYNRTSFLPERSDMMQRWSDYLDELKASKTGTTIQSA